jgi:cytochrome b6-f complex iron-sulfur subunit
MSAMPSNVEPKNLPQAKPEAPLTRAGFLSIAGKSLLALCGLLGLGGLVEFMSFQPDPAPPTQFDLGLASDYPPGSRTLVAEGRAVLLHGASGFTALSLICPHLGCTVEQAPDGFACPCHGSRFDPQGNVRNGPASQPMKSLKVEETPDGRLVLHTGS